MMIRKISEVVYKISGIFVVILLGLIAFFVFTQVISRYIFHFSIAWAQELTVYMMVWMVFLGCSMGLRQGEIASISFLVDKLTKKIAVWFICAVDLMLIIFFIICIISNREIIKFAMKQSSPVLNIPIGWVSLSLTISFALMIFYSLIHILDNLKKTYLVNEQEKEDKLS